MTRTESTRQYDVVVGAGARVFQHLVDAVQRCIDAGAFRASTHGRGDRRVGRRPRRHVAAHLHAGFPWPDIEALVDHVCDTQTRGLSAPVHEDQGATP